MAPSSGFPNPEAAEGCQELEFQPDLYYYKWLAAGDESHKDIYHPTCHTMTISSLLHFLEVNLSKVPSINIWSAISVEEIWYPNDIAMFSNFYDIGVVCLHHPMTFSQYPYLDMRIFTKVKIRP